MPSRNLVRQFEAGGIYHIYNRGINKEKIFHNKHDYSTFLFYLKIYLEDPKDIEELDAYQKRTSTLRKNFFGKIDLLCYCLMPNHFHLLLKQKEERNISDFMKSFITTYSMFFNRRYERVGPLFQSRYRAALVKDDNYLLHLSRYIHKNPAGIAVEDQILDKLADYPYSSYANYLGKKNTPWLKTNLVLEYFKRNKNQLDVGKERYNEFVEDRNLGSEELLRELTLE